MNGFSALVRLEPGDSGDDVAALQEALAKAGFYHSAVDGEFGRTTASAVVAFHKYLGLDRSGAFSALDWIRLALLPDPGPPPAGPRATTSRSTWPGNCCFSSKTANSPV